VLPPLRAPLDARIIADRPRRGPDAVGRTDTANGAGLLIHDATDGVLELTIPGGDPAGNGIGWKVNKSGTTWT